MGPTHDWNDQRITALSTKADGAGTWIVLDYAENLIRTDIEPWPPPAVVQKLYRSDRLGRAKPEIQNKAKAKLGFYCDLQSLHSEDAITWSFFGPLAAAGPRAGAAFLNWLCDRLDLSWTDNQTCSIDLWRRVVHPKTLVSSGPELDFMLYGDQCVIFGEAKWFSSEGRHGPGPEDTQMHYRRRVLDERGPGIYGGCGRALVGVALDQGIEDEVPGPVGGVETRATLWREMGEYEEHHCAAEFRRYYEWKLEHMSAAHRRAYDRRQVNAGERQVDPPTSD